MRQYESYIQIIIIIIEKKDKIKRERQLSGEREGVKREIFIYFSFLFFASL